MTTGVIMVTKLKGYLRMRPFLVSLTRRELYHQLNLIKNSESGVNHQLGTKIENKKNQPVGIELVKDDQYLMQLQHNLMIAVDLFGLKIIETTIDGKKCHKSYIFNNSRGWSLGL